MINQLVDGTDPYSAGDNYQYDGAGRLVRARITGHDYQYGFATPTATDCPNVVNGVDRRINLNANRNTNRTSVSDNGVVTAKYCYDTADRLMSTTDSRYSAGDVQYDVNGNMTSLGTGQTMAYDSADRHIKTMSGTSSIDYVRDAEDRIIQRTTSTGGGSTPSVPTSYKINFGPQGGTTPSGYTLDYGLAYDNTRGYGWRQPPPEFQLHWSVMAVNAIQ